jgi:AraC family transcriptional regulator
MDWLIRMNQVLEYIEDHLTEEINYHEIQRISCTSGDLFQRMFSNFTNIPLSEYIRRRRLSDAAIALTRSETSILDLSLLYGYDSPDAFSYAFKKLHGVSPSECRKKDVTVLSYPKLSFQITMKGEKRMKYRIVEKKAFKVVGKSIQTSQERNMSLHEIPRFWDQFNQSTDAPTLWKYSIQNGMLGVCYNGKEDGSFSYMIGVVSSSSSAEFETLDIPEASWAVFESIGPMPDAIQQVWKDIYQHFLPTSGYEHAPIADFELYPEGDIHSEDYYCEVWIPIQKSAT